MDPQVLLKTKFNWNRKDKKKNHSIGDKVMNIFYCGLILKNLIEYLCAPIQRYMDTVEVTHEGTNQVKKSKINLLIHKYELFNDELH